MGHEVARAGVNGKRQAQRLGFVAGSQQVSGEHLVALHGARKIRCQSILVQISRQTLHKLLPLRSAAQAYGLGRSEEHTSELQSLMRISYAVFCLKKKKQHTNKNNRQLTHPTST